MPNIYANPYGGSEFGFPKSVPENLPSTGFVGWLIQEGYPQDRMVAPPGFPEGTPFFVACYDADDINDPSNPNNPNYIDPYDPQVSVQTAPPEEPPLDNVSTRETIYWDTAEQTNRLRTTTIE